MDWQNQGVFLFAFPLASDDKILYNCELADNFHGHLTFNTTTAISNVYDYSDIERTYPPADKMQVSRQKACCAEVNHTLSRKIITALRRSEDHATMAVCKV